MSYISLSFLLFVAAAGLIYFIVPKKARWVILLAASLIFYSVNSELLVVFIIGAAAVIYFAGLGINKRNENWKVQRKKIDKARLKDEKAKFKAKKKRIVALAVSALFAALIVLKYGNFIIMQITALLGSLGLELNVDGNILKGLLPLGISYYTLQGVSYITDVYRGKIKAETNFFKLLLFLSFFPQVVEGPIGRYDLLAPGLYGGSSFDFDRFRSGALLILWGFVKKVIIADRAALLVNTVFSDGSEYSGAVAALGAIMYTIQIYADFSGCIDIVTGISEIFGVQLSPNFERPFFSKSIAEFWRRWHITLGTWLKDYVFYSVSLSKGFGKVSKTCRTKLKAYFAMLVPTALALFPVWLFNGFWHGASWKYVFYGMYYYLLMMLGQLMRAPSDKLIKTLKINTEAWYYKGFQILRTAVLVAFGMLIFRADSLSTAFAMIRKIFTEFSPSSIFSGEVLKLGLDIKDFAVLAVGVILIFIVSLLQEKGKEIRPAILRQKLPVRWIIYLAAIFSLIIFGMYGSGFNAGQFIYGQF